MRWLVIAMLLISRPALAECDLSQLIGYTLVFSKIVNSYVQDGKHLRGFEGCTRDRVLVFADNTGVRCKDTFIQQGNFPRAYRLRAMQTI